MQPYQEHDQVSAIIAECLRRSDAGEVIVPEDVLVQHPDHADELREYFHAERQLANALGIGDCDKQRRAPHATLFSAAGETIPVGGECFRQLPVDFGRYRILKKLGQGAMGAVYLAHDTKLSRDIALKTPAQDAFADSEMAARFEREACSAATLHHRNICPVFDVGEIDGIRFLTMAYIEGQPLSDFVSAENPMSCRRAAEIIRKLALGLQEAHARGVIHRDLKPANIMIDKAREPVVMDFGLAGQTENIDQGRLTGVGVLMGSPAYMSPEQVSGNPAAVTHAADIYSLGVILYELLTGRLPFDGSVIAIIGQIVNADPPKLCDLRADVDPSLAAICCQLMAKSADVRYATMQQAAEALTEYLRGSAQKSEKPAAASAGDRSHLVLENVTAEKSAATVSRPMLKAHGSRNNNHTRRQLRWTAAAFLSLLVLAAIIIKFRDGTSVTITDDRSTKIELATNEDGGLKSLNITSNSDTRPTRPRSSDLNGPDAVIKDAAPGSEDRPVVIGNTITLEIQGGTQALAVSPDDQYFAVVNGEAPWQILVREVHTGLPISRFALPGVAGAGVRHLSYTPDGKSLFCCVGTHWSLVNANDGSEQVQMEFPASPDIVVFPKRPLVLALYHEQAVHRTKQHEVLQRIRIWNWQSGEIMYDDNLPFVRSPNNYPAVSPDERFLTYGREHFHVRCTLSIDDSDVTIGSPVEMEQTSRVRGPLVFSSDGRYAATNVKSKQGMAVVLNPESGRILYLIDPESARADNEGHQYGCSFAFTADSSQIVTADHTGLVTVWDTASGSRIRVLEQFRKSGNHMPPQVAMTGNGHVIVAGGFADPRITIQPLNPE